MTNPITLTTPTSVALAYAVRGWHVFPCKLGAKTPLTEHGFLDATTDEAAIKAWWEQWADANIGIATGSVSGLVVIDVDAEHEGPDTLRELEDRYGALPNTVEAITGGGGRHIYFEHPGGNIPNSAGTLGSGLDIRGDGGYVIVPPSLHPNGRRYEWEVSSHPEDVKVAPMPPWLVGLLRAPTRSQGKYPDKGEPIKDGQRNATLASLAGSMRRPGMSEDAILAALLTENDLKCEPPLDAEEVRRIARSIGGYEPSPSLKPTAPDSNILTDTTNAEFIASLYGDQLRFDHRRRRWLRWAAHYWREDTSGEVYRLATAAARERYGQSVNIVDLDERRRVATWSIGSEQRTRLENAVALAKNIKPIADGGETWDTDPWLLGVANGVVDLRTGVRRSGRPDDQITMTTNIEFDPEAKCPRWEKFLQEVIGETELIDWLRRALGYSITGDTTEQCIFLCHGIGANGKTKFVEAVREAMGGYAYSSPFSTFERYQRASIPNDLAALEHKRFVTSSETNDNTRLNEARIKAISGGDPITARYLHLEYFTFVPHLKLWLFVNHRPKVVDDSHGFWRRVKLIPFTKQFTGVADDKRLGETLRSEAPGILAWLVKGCLEWQQRGLEPAPRAVEVATEEYRAESDELGDFIIERCIPGGRVWASGLYKAYTNWAAEQGMKDKEVLSAKAFGTRIGNRYHRGRETGGVFYAGLTLKSGADVGSMYDSKASAPEINVFPHTPLHVEKTTEILHNPTLATKTLHNPTSDVGKSTPTKGPDVVEVE